MNKNSRLVYSTETGRIRKDRHKQTVNHANADGVIRVSRETKGRKGKGVTIISGLDLDPEALKSQAKQLKQLCGTGGTVKQGLIEIQGDHRDAIVEYLQKAGHQVKRAGG